MIRKLIIPILLLSFIFSIDQALAGERVSLSRPSAMQQIYLVKQLKPDLAKIGVLCEVSQHPNLAKQLARISAQLGVKVFIENTPNLLSVSKNFKDLVIHKQVDAIWVFPDKALNQLAAQKYLIKETILAKVLLIGSDPEMVKKGAALCALKANDQIRLFLNEKALGLLGLKIKDDIAKKVEIVMN